MTQMTKDVARRMLGPVPESNVFWCHDGRVFKNLDQLRAGLAGMSDDTFAYHVTPEKNDFSNWVRTSVGDTKLAGELDKSADRTQSLKRVEERLAFLRDRLS